MAYRDFDATTARGMWSPPNGAAPQMLPDQWKDDPNSDALRYDLPELSDAQLLELGWVKVNMPSYESKGAEFFKNSYEWNSSTRSYDATELDDFEKIEAVSYLYFWNELLETDVYATMKTAASTSLAANTMLTEFIALLDDAKNKNPNSKKIQESITGILAGITFTTEEIAELQVVFDSTGMSNIYTLS